MTGFVNRCREATCELVLRARVLKLLAVRRVSYRGGALLTFAFIDFVIAYSLTAPGSLPNTPSYKVIALVPYQAWAVIWLLVGLVCAVQAFARHNDAYGFRSEERRVGKECRS